MTLHSPPSPAERNLQEHMRGRPHLRRLDSLKSAEKSVYIRGFPPDLTRATLCSFLEEQVGSVQSIWLSDEVCDLIYLLYVHVLGVLTILYLLCVVERRARGKPGVFSICNLCMPL